MRVVVLGAGSLGSLYGAWFARAGAEVTLVGRPAHAAAVRSTGLRVGSHAGDEDVVRLDATDDAQCAPDADLVLLASKAHDTAALLQSYRGEPSAAFSVQNGIGQAEPLVARFGPAAVGCVSMVGATLTGPGTVVHTFPGVTYVGDITSSRPGTAERIAGALGTVPVDVRPDIVNVIWSKAVLAVGAMGVPALTRLPYHRVFQLPPLREVFLDLVAEAAAVAAAEDVGLVDLPGPLQAGTLARQPRDEALHTLAAIGDAMEAAGQTEVIISIVQSIERGRPLEVDAVFSQFVARADRHGLAIPVLRAVTRLLEGLDADLRRRSGAAVPAGAVAARTAGEEAR